MTPYELSILLHYYVSPEDHPDFARQPPVWVGTLASFLGLNLLAARIPIRDQSVYIITPRGEAYVQALQRVPLPVQEWKVEWPKN